MSDRDATSGPVPEGTEPAADAAVRPQKDEFRLSVPAGLGAIVAALASLATCYAGIVAGAVLGIPWLSINPHLQAVLMWGLALVTVVFLWRDQRRHGSNLPLAVGGLAALTLVVTLYLAYDERLEALAYTLLVIAALLNQILLLDRMNRTVRQQASEIETLNRSLAQRVQRQEHEIDRLGRLKQFLPPQVAELVVAEGNEALLDTHRRYIACLFCDIRNFTTLSEAVEPEDVITILQQFHDRVGGLVAQHGGTIGYRAGDGLMVFFNDPIPCDQPALQAMRLARDIRAAFDDIRSPWQKLGHAIGLGIGVACGYATLGLVGFHGRADYTAIGGVVNTASRLCDLATDGQILISQRARLDVEGRVEAEAMGPVELKGLGTPVEVHQVVGFAESPGARAAPAAGAGR